MGRYIWYADWFLAPAARLSHHSAIKMIIFVIQTTPSWCLVVHTHFYAKSRPCGQVNMPGCLRRHITWCYYYLKCEIVIVWLFDCLSDQSIHTFTCSDDIWPRNQTDRQTMPRIDTNLSLKLTEFKWYCIPLPATSRRRTRLSIWKRIGRQTGKPGNRMNNTTSIVVDKN